jgi:hypothetical protein
MKCGGIAEECFLVIEVKEYKVIIKKTKYLHEGIMRLTTKMDNILDAIGANVTGLESYKYVKVCTVG